MDDPHVPSSHLAAGWTSPCKTAKPQICQFFIYAKSYDDGTFSCKPFFIPNFATLPIYIPGTMYEFVPVFIPRTPRASQQPPLLRPDGHQLVKEAEEPERNLVASADLDIVVSNEAVGNLL